VHLCLKFFKYWLLFLVGMWFWTLLNSLFSCMNLMWNVVMLESVGKNVTNFPGSHFLAQQASMNLLIKSGKLGNFWTINLLFTYRRKTRWAFLKLLSVAICRQFQKKEHCKNCVRHWMNEKYTHTCLLKQPMLVDLQQKVGKFFP
jgi:hypothetical protein